MHTFVTEDLGLGIFSLLGLLLIAMDTVLHNGRMVEKLGDAARKTSRKTSSKTYGLAGRALPALE